MLTAACFCNEYINQVEWALNDAGVALLPALMVQRYLDDGRLVHIFDEYTGPVHSLQLCYRTPSQMRQAALLVKEFLHDHLLERAQ
jgi:DNA-binding transcriptional LysR family regulator